MAEFPLKRLNRLRKYAKGLDIEQYLLSEHRQNLKAIEDSLKSLEQQIVDPTEKQVLVSVQTGGINNTTSFVDFAEVDIVTTASLLRVETIINRPSTGAGIDGFATTGTAAEIRILRNGVQISIITMPSLSTLAYYGIIDATPENGTYTIQARTLAAGIVGMNNMSLMVSELKF